MLIHEVFMVHHELRFNLRKQENSYKEFCTRSRVKSRVVYGLFIRISEKEEIFMHAGRLEHKF